MTDFELVRLAFDELDASPGFADWLAAERLCIAMTKGNALCLVGTRDDGSVTTVERAYGQCIGLAADGDDALLLASRYQIWRLQNSLPPGATTDDGHDRLFLPQTAWTTGTLLIRDLALDGAGGIVFVNGLFSCLATPDERLSFAPWWLPPFISVLAPGDRCHLSGLAIDRGRPAFVTSASTSDVLDGWREHRRDGGVVVSVPAGEVVARGLSMPSSPRLSGGRLLVCQGGRGELSAIDPDDGTVETVASLPGFARGLAVRGDRVIVATSRPQRGETFDGLPLGDRLSGSAASGHCGLHVIDLGSGRVEHSLTFTGGASEIHGLALIGGARSATAAGYTGGDVQEWVTYPTPGEPGSVAPHVELP